jgi:UDPglucose 6-dehydrogenase
MKQLNTKSYNIVIVGAGTVGEATGKGLAKKGHQVSYVDINPNRIAQLRRQNLQAMTAQEVDWSQADIIMLTVSTPTINNRIVLDHLESATLDVGRGLCRNKKFAVVVVRSTVPPTTTEEYLTPLLERKSGKRAGVDFGVAMNPEFLRQRYHEQDFARPWITVLGTSDAKTAKILHELYAPFGGLIVNYCTPTEAEMIKYVHNIYNAVKISYFNEIHQICERLGLNSDLIGAVVARSAEAMWNPLYGIHGGVPYGGACLPKDTAAFMQFCQECDFEPLMLQATIEVNERLAAQIPAATSPEEIEDILGSSLAHSRNGVGASPASNGRAKHPNVGLQPEGVIMLGSNSQKRTRFK